MDQELDDRRPLAPATAETLMERLKAVVKDARLAEELIEGLKIELADEEEAQKKRVREHIPDLMAELGLEEATVDGIKITLRNDLQISMVDAAAIDWLDKHGFGGLVKTKVEVSYMREDREAAIKAKEMLEGLGAIVELKETVHWQTLKAWGRERVEHGEALPEEHFNLMSFVEAKLKAVPQKRG